MRWPLKLFSTAAFVVCPTAALKLCQTKDSWNNEKPGSFVETSKAARKVNALFPAVLSETIGVNKKSFPRNS